MRTLTRFCAVLIVLTCVSMSLAQNMGSGDMAPPTTEPPTTEPPTTEPTMTEPTMTGPTTEPTGEAPVMTPCLVLHLHMMNCVAALCARRPEHPFCSMPPQPFPVECPTALAQVAEAMLQRTCNELLHLNPETP